jgi:hypothetical protein
MAIPSSGIINPAPALSLFALPFENNLPMILSHNLTIQHELMSGLSLEVGYVGNRGYNQPFNKRLDASLPGTGNAGIPLNQKFGCTAQTTLRAYGVDSYYNSLQAQLEKRLSRGISFGTSYTWSRSTDYTSNNGGLNNPIFLELNYGPSDFDRSHTLTIHHTLELPFEKGKAYLNSGPLAVIAGDWQVNGILSAYSGRPFTLSMSNAALNGGPGNALRPDQLRQPSISGTVGPGTTWFDVTAFANPIPAVATCQCLGEADKEEGRSLPLPVPYQRPIILIASLQSRSCSVKALPQNLGEKTRSCNLVS